MLFLENNVKKCFCSFEKLAKCELKKLLLSCYDVLLVSERDGLEVERTDLGYARGCVSVTLWSSVCVANISHIEPEEIAILDFIKGT